MMKEWEEVLQRQDILDAVSSVYPVIILANLTKNCYIKWEYQLFFTGENVSTGVFDEFVESGLDKMEPEYQEMFRNTFSREMLTKRFLAGDTEVFGEVKQLCADGKEHWLDIHAVCISRDEKDLREICFVRIIDDQKAQEAELKRQLDDKKQEIYEQELSIKQALEYEKLANECMRLFYHVENLKQSVDRVMELTASYFQVDRSFVCEVFHDRVFNIFEYCAEGIESKRQLMQDLDIHMFDCWMPLFIQDKYAVCEDVESLPDEAEELRSFLKRADVQRVILIPVSFEGEIRLFLGYDNPKLENENFMTMIDTLIAMAIVGINRVYMERKRNILMYKDSLTALWNRTRMNEDIHERKKRKEAAGIIFLDVNGLKEMNDNFSHEAGDMLLKACVRVLLEKFPKSVCDEKEWKERAYRIGGDEFVVWLKGISREEFDRKQGELQELYEQADDCSVSIGGVFSEEAADVFEMIKAADDLMYQDKKRYYAQIVRD